MGPDVVLGIILLWLLPIFVAKQIGDGKNRAGIVYGLLLGWIGVIILLMVPKLPDDRGRGGGSVRRSVGLDD